MGVRLGRVGAEGGSANANAKGVKVLFKETEVLVRCADVSGTTDT